MAYVRELMVSCYSRQGNTDVSTNVLCHCQKILNVTKIKYTQVYGKKAYVYVLLICSLDVLFGANA